MDAIVPAGMETEAWTQLAGEKPRAFQAFSMYRDMGPGRTLYGLTKQLGLDRANNGHIPGNLLRWNTKHRWNERAQAYDAYRDGMRRQEIDRLDREDVQKWDQRRRTLREVEWEFHDLLMAKAREILRLPIVRAVKDEIVETYEDGREKVINRTILNPAARIADASRIGDVASKLARLAAEMETSRDSLNINATVREMALQLNLSEDDTATVIQEAEQIMRSARIG